MGDKYIQKKGVSHLIQAALTPCSRVSREDCFDVPDIVYSRCDITLSPQQRRMIKELKTGGATAGDHGDIVAVNSGVLALKLLQVCSGAVYDADKNVTVIQSCIKQRADIAIEEYKETGMKVIVVSRFTHQLEALAEYLTKTTKTRVLTLYGKTSDKEGNDFERAFNDDSDVAYAVVDPESIQHGFTLPAANTVVWASPTHRPEAWIQTNDRPFAARSANKQTLGIVYTVVSAFEAAIYRALMDKSQQAAEELDLISLCSSFINSKEL